MLWGIFYWHILGGFSPTGPSLAFPQAWYQIHSQPSSTSPCINISIKHYYYANAEPVGEEPF